MYYNKRVVKTENTHKSKKLLKHYLQIVVSEKLRFTNNIYIYIRKKP